MEIFCLRNTNSWEVYPFGFGVIFIYSHFYWYNATPLLWLRVIGWCCFWVFNLTVVKNAWILFLYIFLTLLDFAHSEFYLPWQVSSFIALYLFMIYLFRNVFEQIIYNIWSSEHLLECTFVMFFDFFFSCCYRLINR
jgi:hypothetical protein